MDEHKSAFQVYQEQQRPKGPVIRRRVPKKDWYDQSKVKKEFKVLKAVQAAQLKKKKKKTSRLPQAAVLAENGLTKGSSIKALTVKKLKKELPLKATSALKKREWVSTSVGANGHSVQKRQGLPAKQRATPGGPDRTVQAKDDGDSLVAGQACIDWILHPKPWSQFKSDSWQKLPVHIGRDDADYYSQIFSTAELDLLLRKHNVVYGKNLDVTSYSDGKRETHNPVGRAHAAVVWDFYSNGCSVRLLNPQTYSDQVWRVCATLQDFFGCMVGANVYLTPPGCQGFAPHFDDVDVFILQLEGQKRWRLYGSRTEQDKLPRFSSPNFSQEEIGKPIMDVTLKAGSVLYLPRGTIHQAVCSPDHHSLHITISCNQLNTFGDLLLKLVPAALENALTEDVAFREGLPLDYLSFMGVARADNGAKKRRQTFLTKIQTLMQRLYSYAPVDAAVDQMGKQLMRDALPPFITHAESQRCVINGADKWHPDQLRVVDTRQISPDTEVRLLRARCLQMLLEEDGVVRIYHCADNSRQYQEVEPQPLEIDPDSAVGVELLLSAYPKYVKVAHLPMQTEEAKLLLVQDLWERGLVITRLPLPAAATK